MGRHACWSNVPEKVWDFTIGGYQVLKKWLSYRERDLLGRALTADEARVVTHIARRLAALLLLQPELDANYRGGERGSGSVARNIRRRRLSAPGATSQLSMIATAVAWWSVWLMLR